MPGASAISGALLACMTRRTNSVVPCLHVAAAARGKRGESNREPQQLQQRVLHHRARNFLYRVERGHDRQAACSVPKQLNNILAAVPPVNAILVLQQHGVVALRTRGASLPAARNAAAANIPAEQGNVLPGRNRLTLLDVF